MVQTLKIDIGFQSINILSLKKACINYIFQWIYKQIMLWKQNIALFVSGKKS